MWATRPAASCTGAGKVEDFLLLPHDNQRVAVTTGHWLQLSTSGFNMDIFGLACYLVQILVVDYKTVPLKSSGDTYIRAKSYFNAI